MKYVHTFETGRHKRQADITLLFKYILCTAIFNVCGETLITGHLQKIDYRKLSKTWVSKAQDLSLTENSSQLFLPGVCNKLAKYPIYLSLAPRPNSFKQIKICKDNIFEEYFISQ